MLGKTVRIDGKPATIVGVMPDGDGVPEQHRIVDAARPDGRRSRSAAPVPQRLWTPAARRQPAAGADGVRTASPRRLATAYPDTNKDVTGAIIETFNERFNGGQIRAVFLSLLGAVGFVLLIACANVANLLLVALGPPLARDRRPHRARRHALARRPPAARRERAASASSAASSRSASRSIGVRLFDNAVAGSGKPYWIQFTMDYTVFAYLAAHLRR